MNDHAESATEGSFTPDEQAAWDAYERGEDAPATAQEPAGGQEPPAAREGAPETAKADPAPAGEPAATPGDVVDPDEAGADDPEANKGRFVRHGAFHKERERRKAVEGELTALREQFARGDERMRLLLQAAQHVPQAPAAAPAEPEKAPDPNEDIFGYAKYLEKQIADLHAGHKEVSEAQRKQVDDARTQAEERAVISSYQQDVARAAQADPSFVESYNFLIAGRVEELKLMGLDHAGAVQQANADELALVRSAMQRGQSPAALMAQLAKSRGFVAKAAEPAVPAAPVETAADKAARAAAGQAGPGRSLAGAGGGPAGEVTIEMLASMSEADFEKFAANNPRKLEALMGA